MALRREVAFCGKQGGNAEYSVLEFFQGRIFCLRILLKTYEDTENQMRFLGGKKDDNKKRKNNTL